MCLVSFSPASRSQNKSPQKAQKQFLNPSGFIENKGQWSKELSFIGTTSFGQIGFGVSTIYLHQINVNENTGNQVIQLSLEGAKNVIPVGIDPYPTNYHFYQGRDQTKWINNAKMFRSIQYPDIYPGIDLYYQIQGKNPKYEFHVKPGADPNKIRIKVTGTEVTTDDNKVTFSTSHHDIQDTGLLVYEYQSSHQLNARFKAIDSHSYGFLVGHYDKKQILIIDPVISENYLAGTGNYEQNEGSAEVLDSDGNLYITGFTSSSNFPVTPGAYFPINLSSPYQYNTFVSKLDQNGNLIYSLLIASSDSYYETKSFAIAVTPQMEVVIAGTTNTSDFPTTPSAYQSSVHGGFDFFVCQFNDTGSQLLMSTLIGGTNDEEFGAYGSTLNQNYFDFPSHNPLALDQDGNITISGNTISTDFPTTPNRLKTTNSFGRYQIVIFTIHSSGSTLLYSTYFGGSRMDASLTLIGDDQNNIYLGGFTSSFNFFTTPGAFQTHVIMNGFNGFVSKFHIDPVSHQLTPIFSTILGSGDTFVNSLDLDQDYHIFAVGSTYSSGFSPTPSDFRPCSFYSFGTDIFIAKLDRLGTELLGFLFLGGTEEDSAVAVSLDASGFPYVVGNTRSGDFPVTEDAFFPNPVSGLDIFMFRINPSLDEISFSTYYGEDSGVIGEANDIIVTKDNLVYFLGSYYYGGGYRPELPYSNHLFKIDPPSNTSSFYFSGQVILSLTYTIPLIFPGTPVLTLTASNNTFTLDWSATTGDYPLDGFVLYQSIDGSPFSYFDDFGPSTFSTIDNNIASGMSYSYCIEAYDDQGNYSGLSNVVSYTKPSVPTNLRTASPNESITVSWDFSTAGTSGIAKYIIFRSEDPTFLSPIIVGNAPFSQNYFEDTTVIIGKTYYFKVQAQDSNGIDSFLSSIISGVAIAQSPILALSPMINKTLFEKGEAVLLKVIVHNLGGHIASNVILSTLLPETVEFTSVDSGLLSVVSGKLVTIPLGNILGRSNKELNLICHIKGSVNTDTSAIILFTATCLENVSAQGQVSFILKARKTTTSSVSVSIQVQNTEQDPVTGKRFVKLGDPLVVTYDIIGGVCPYTIYVDWGDGTKETIVIKCFQDVTGVLKHTYQSRGTFHIKIKIEDASGQSKNSDFEMEIR